MAETYIDEPVAPSPYDYEYLGGDAELAEPELPPELQQLAEWSTADNIAKTLSDDVLAKIGQTAHEKYKIDDASRSEWAESARKAIELVGGKKSSKNWPFENASNVKYPLLQSAVNQFASRAYPAILKDGQLVKVKIEGKDADGSKLGRSQRIEQHMSYQLLHQMEEWEEDTDALIHQLPVVGCCFRKTYWDSAKGRPVSEMISALDLVVNINVPSLGLAPQVSHEHYRYPHEIEERVRKGIYIDQDLGTADAEADEDKHAESGEDKDTPHKFIECHCYYDLDGDGLPEPWIVTVHDATMRVVRVAPGYAFEDIETDNEGNILAIKRENYFTKYIFWPDPKGGFYGRGLGHALEDISETINTTLNQMLDAGSLQNAGGGFIGAGLNTKKATLRFSPGVYHTVNAPGSTVRDAIVHVQHPGPSTVLFQLLGQLVDVAKELAGNTDAIQGDIQTNMQPTTLMALIEQGLQQFTAIYKRIYRSLGKEFQLLRKLNARYLPDEQYQRFLDDDQPVSAEQDYSEGDMDIYPVANPNIVTHMQRAARNQFLLEMSRDPELGRFLKKPVILMRILKDSQIDEIDEVIESDPPPSPAEQAQMQAAQAASERETAEANLAKAKILEIQGKQEEAQTNAAKTRIEGALKMMEAEGMALDISFKEALVSKFMGIEDVESISIQGVGSIKEQDKDPKAVSSVYPGDMQ